MESSSPAEGGGESNTVRGFLDRSGLSGDAGVRGGVERGDAGWSGLSGDGVRDGGEHSIDR